MVKLLGALPLLSGVLGAFEEHNTVAGENRPVYYDDSKRLLPWLNDAAKTDYFRVDPVSGEATGNWDIPNSAISLGCGSTAGRNYGDGLQDQSSAWAVDFIEAVKASVNLKQTDWPLHPDHPHKVAVGTDPWKHIRNFWYRDGDLFAYIQDDNAMDMMGGGENLDNPRSSTSIPPQEQPVLDVFVKTDSAGDVAFEVRKEAHHMEYLRKFCKRMGGDLWAPSSQAEYDDLIEHEDGVCHKHKNLVKDGKFDSGVTDGTRTKINIYLNLEREGYRACPLGVAMPLGSATHCGTLGTRDYGLTDDAEWDANKEFFTTDPSFAGFNGERPYFCGETPIKSTYSIFRINRAADACPVEEAKAEIPYIKECYWNFDAGTTNFDGEPIRFQKFVIADRDALNELLDTRSDSQYVLQNDCVHIFCEGKIDGEDRWASEWSLEKCNKQEYTGICRIRATGCSDPSYDCASSWTRTCGSHAAITKSDTKYRSRAVQAQLEANCASIADPVDKAACHADMETVSRAPSSISDSTTTTIYTCANSRVQALIAEANPSETAGIIISDACLPADVAVATQAARATRCPCNCYSWGFNWDTATVRWVAGGPTVTSVMAHPGSTNTTPLNGLLGTSYSYTCNAVADKCKSGSHSAICKMNADTFSATWEWSTVAHTCSLNCCRIPYSNAINTGASIVNPAASYLPGETYTVACNDGMHVQGEATTVTSKTFIVSTNLDVCFQPLVCVGMPCPGCPELVNGVCYNRNDLTHSATPPFVADATLRCRCNECFVMTGALRDYPWLDVRCSPPSWVGSGTCQKLQCSNPHDLLDALGNTVGWYVGDGKSDCGDSINYVCRPGYHVSGNATITSTCRSTGVGVDNPGFEEGDWGNQGFYDLPTGTCVPDDYSPCSEPPATPENAWDAVFLGSDHAHASCHGTYAGVQTDAFYAANAADRTSWSNGEEAVFECFDDFSAVMNANFLTTTSNAAEDINCAAGTDNVVCRLDQTDVLFAAHTADRTKAPIWSNDKLVTRCVNGAWTAPTHSCMCDDKIARRHAALIKMNANYFTADCACILCKGEASTVPPTTTSGAFTSRFIYTLSGAIPLAFVSF